MGHLIICLFYLSILFIIFMIWDQCITAFVERFAAGRNTYYSPFPLAGSQEAGMDTSDWLLTSGVSDIPADQHTSIGSDNI